MSKVMEMKQVSLVRGKTNFDFDMLWLYFIQKLMEILLFMISTLFQDVSKICKIRCIKILIS